MFVRWIWITKVKKFKKWSLPTHEPQSPAPGDPGGLSKCPFNKMEGSVSFDSNEEILQVSSSYTHGEL